MLTFVRSLKNFEHAVDSMSRKCINFKVGAEFDFNFYDC